VPIAEEDEMSLEDLFDNVERIVGTYMRKGYSVVVASTVEDNARVSQADGNEYDEVVIKIEIVLRKE